MRIVSIIIFTAWAIQLNAQNGIKDILVILNQPLQEEVEYTIDTMFNGQDTIFTETDSFILFTTPDMIIGDIDTLEYRYIRGTVKEWNHNGDELTDYIAVIYLADKRTKLHLDAEANQYLLVATGNEEESYDISYFEPVIACGSCGQEGSLPDISILINGQELEITEEGTRGNQIFSDEFYVTYTEDKFIVNKKISALYSDSTDDFLLIEENRSTMMKNLEYESSNVKGKKFKAAIMPAELTRPITIDGELTEEAWNKEHKLNWRPVHSILYGEKHTMNDLFAKYSVAWNKNNLFIAFNIKDDVLVPITFDGNEIKGDYIQLDLDLNNNKLKKGVLATEFSNDHISLGIGFDKYGKPSVMNLNTQELLEGINVAFGRKGDGYTAEIQLSVDNIKTILSRRGLGNIFQIGKSIAFTASVGDADNRENTSVQNINASSSMHERIPFMLGEIELFRTYTDKTLKSYKAN